MHFLESAVNFSFLGFNHWAYVLIFFAAMFEAVPLLGFFSPGMVVVVAGGFMAKLGILDIGDLILIASTAAILGDCVGYAIGRKYGVTFLEKYGKYFFFHKAQFDKTRNLMHNHTGKALVIGRFNSLTRALAPFVAGSSHTPSGRFMFYNVLGGLLWTTVFVLVGFIFGHSYEVASRFIGGFVTAAVVGGFAIVYTYRFVDKRRHIFSKYHLYTLIINVFSLYLFLKMVEDVIDGESIIKLDVWLSETVMTWWSSPLNEVVIFITNLAGPLILSLLTAALLGYFIIKNKRYQGWLLFMGMSGGVVLELSIKFLMQRERPAQALVEVSNYSFPSGHTTMATIFLFFLLYAYKDEIKNKVWKIIFVSGIAATIISVGLSRVYLNAHWFSDVLAGMALGAFWLTLLVLIFRFISSGAYKILYGFRDIFGKDK